ncbi:hypothetical protein [Frischella sp. Ac48]|nr:hypothetical protein [Frischella sp. Ac48]
MPLCEGQEKDRRCQLAVIHGATLLPALHNLNDQKQIELILKTQ